jgi:hypothetical protein
MEKINRRKFFIAGLGVVGAVVTGCSDLSDPAELEHEIISPKNANTVFQALTRKKIRVNYEFTKINSEKNSNKSAFITKINGITNDPNNNIYWMFFVNGEYCVQSPFYQRVQTGDLVHAILLKVE